MSVDTFQPHLRRPLKAETPPKRLPIKRPATASPAGAATASPGGRKQSAVERLEADKAKYVKSQGVLTKQQPIRPPPMCKPMLSPRTDLRPTRRTPLPSSSPQQGGAPLDLKHLSNLINGVSDVTLSPTADDPEESKAPSCAPSNPTSPSPLSVRGGVGEGIPCSPRSEWSGTTKMKKIPAPGPVNGEPPGSAGSPTAVTVRRVDVIPHSGPGLRTTSRPQQVRLPLKPLQPSPFHPHLPLNIVASRLRLLHPRTSPVSSPVKPVCAPPIHNHTVFPPAPAASPPSDPPVPGPSSPTVTRQSSFSSRKRPSLTRSKSDMSDRFSRAGTDLERFFNLCGLDSTELQVLAGPASDIVSIARLRSASAPGSECAGTGQEEEEEEDEVAERTPYGVSVIERNARVIKWLYSLRQAKDTARSTNM